MIVKTRNADYDFWELTRKGAEIAAREYGMKLHFDGPENETEIEEQIKLVEKAIDEKPKAIVLAAVDFVHLDQVVERATKYGIPVITIDSGIHSELPISHIATDNKEAGKSLGNKIYELVEGQGSVGIISFIRGTQTAIDREAGIMEAFEAFNNVDIAGVKYCNGDSEIAYEQAIKMIQDNPSIKGMIGTNQQALEGIVKAIKMLGRSEDIKVVGFDSSIGLIRDLDKGYVDALLVQKPINMGYLSVEVAYSIDKNEVIEPFISTGYALIDSENMFEPEYSQLLFPFIE